jgi:hypothetical protein
MGTMWWEQSLWRIPPNFDGLVFFMKEIVGALIDPTAGVDG